MDVIGGTGFTPIVKCVGFQCNMRCRYCFYHKLDRVSKPMGADVLEALIKETYRANRHSRVVSFVWHGGEPLLAGRSFYGTVAKLQGRYRREYAGKCQQRTVNGVQTNGTLIDGKWARFFKKNRFEIGISLDGPAEYHDQYRQYGSGQGSFADVMRGIETLREEEVPFGIVSVVTNVSVHHPDEMFRFFVENQLFNVKLSRALGKTNSGDWASFAPFPKDYGRFLLRILELWLEEDNPQINITPINEIFVSLVRGESSSECLFSGQCGKFWIVNPDGGIYACVSEGIEERWKFGNIKEGFEAVMESPEFRGFQEMVRRLRERCFGCEWYPVCRGGCTIDYELDPLFPNKHNVLCGSLRQLFRRAKEVLGEYELV